MQQETLGLARLMLTTYYARYFLEPSLYSLRVCVGITKHEVDTSFDLPGVTLAKLVYCGDA